MENSKTTNEPDSYEAIHCEKIWWDIVLHSLPNTAFLFMNFKNADQRKHKHVYTQDGWCQDEQEEEPIVTLQPDQHVEVISFQKNVWWKNWVAFANQIEFES
jgi:hypothetical protein